MKVVLINPPLSRFTINRINPIIKNLFYNSPPLGLGYLAAVLENSGHSVKIIDAAVENLSIDRTARKVKNISPDIIGITTFTVSIYSCYELAKELKKILPGTKIIVGGPHITSSPEDLLKHPEFDIAVIGEGEITFKELMETIEREDSIATVKGLAFNSEDSMFFTPSREFIADLDVLPFPARYLLPMNLYKPQPNDQKRLPKLSVISSRGCPYSCIFCDKNVFSNIYRSFSPRYIVNEMSHLVREFKAKDIAFVDSTFTSDKERVYEIVKEIKQHNLNVTWTCSIRVDVVDKQLLKEMKNAGCWRVRLGIESGNDEVLKFIKKGITRSQIRKVANWAYELDLEPKGFFMVGHLIDTRQTIKDTIDFACSLPLKDITVQMNTPLKNTPQYKLMKKYGRVITTDFSNYSFWEPIFIPDSLSDRECSCYKEFYLKFYLRPVMLYRHIIKIRSFSDIVKCLKGIEIVFFFLILWLKDKF